MTGVRTFQTPSENVREGFVQKPDPTKLEKLLNEGHYIEGAFEMLDDSRLEGALVTFEFGRRQTHDEQLGERGMERVENRDRWDERLGNSANQTGAKGRVRTYDQERITWMEHPH